MGLLLFSSYLKCCNNCKQMYYCGRDCQVKDWNNGHKFNECKSFKEKYVHVFFEELSGNSSLLPLAFRLALKLKHDSAAKDKELVLFDGSKIKIGDLGTRTDEICAKNKMLKPLAASLVGAGVFKDEREFVVPYCLVALHTVSIETNYYEMFYDTSRHVPQLLTASGVGLYVETSLFGQACKPNAIRTNEGLKAVIRAMADIDTDQADKLSLSYTTSDMRPRKERHAILSQKNLPDCECIRCTSRSDDHDCKRLVKLQTTTLANGPNAFNSAMEGYYLSMKILGEYNAHSFAFLRNAMNTNYKYISSVKVAEMFNALLANIKIMRNCKLPYYRAIEELAAREV